MIPRHSFLPAADLHPFGDAPPPVLGATADALEDADRRALWKPFTQMAQYVAGRPLLMAEGKGCWLRDVRGKPWLDGVASLWVNVHGHCHPHIVARIREQLGRLDHSTLLGPSNVPAVDLAERLLQIAPAAPGQPVLSRVFYSDSGSTAVEIALKMAYQFFAQSRDPAERRRTVFLALSNAYHGDTLGSVSVGGIELFHEMYRPLLFQVERVPAPDPYHRAFGRPVEQDEEACLRALRRALSANEGRVAALVFEPLVQGAAGMLTHSARWLREAVALARAAGALVVADEVATGFGRSGTMFACEQAGLVPDLLCLAKGITGGVLPLAATLATESVFEGFLGDYAEFRAFFHGHSYTGNPLACAAALGSLELFAQEQTLANVAARAAQLGERLEQLADHPHVGDVRHLGLMCGIELVRDRRSGEAYEPALRAGARVVEAALPHGVLLRPLGNVLVLMPPLSISAKEMDLLTGVAFRCLDDVTRAL